MARTIVDLVDMDVDADVGVDVGVEADGVDVHDDDDDDDDNDGFDDYNDDVGTLALALMSLFVDVDYVVGCVEVEVDVLRCWPGSYLR